MMYDPTRGVDIGTKNEIFLLMRAFAAAGGAILFYSTDLPELVNLCDRILVIYSGSVVADLSGGQISEERIMRFALGGAAPGWRSVAVTAKATSARSLFHTIVLPRHRGLTVAVVVFGVIFLAVSALSKGPLSYFDLQFLSSGSATLALAAMGETIVVLVGGFDLSVGAVISLVNVVLATNMTPDLATEVLFSIAALALGAAVGAFNRILHCGDAASANRRHARNHVYRPRADASHTQQARRGDPAGSSAFFTGDAVPTSTSSNRRAGGALVVWGAIKRSRLGTAIYAVGGDEEAATARGINVTRTKFLTYTLAGTYYGAAGLYISASSSGGDPLVGAPMLLQIFTAVVLGGTAFGGGRGGCVGTLFASFTLATIINALLILNVAAYYSTLVQGALLIAAGLAGSLQRRGTLATAVRKTLVHIRAIIDRSAPRYFSGNRTHIGGRRIGASRRDAEDQAIRSDIERSWAGRNAETLRIIWPAWALSALMIGVTAAIYGSGLSSVSYVNSLMVLASFLAVLGLGQGAVVISGGLDLSIPWTVTFTGVLLTGITSANPAAIAWAIPFVLAIGAAYRRGKRNWCRGAWASGDCYDARNERHSPSSRARLQQWHPYRRGAGIAAVVHDRQTRRPGAFRLGADHFRNFRDIIAESHHLRPTALRRRQQPRGSSAVGCWHRPSINRRLCS